MPFSTSFLATTTNKTKIQNNKDAVGHTETSMEELQEQSWIECSFSLLLFSQNLKKFSQSVILLHACVYIYSRHLSSFRAPALWFIDLTVATAIFNTLFRVYVNFFTRCHSRPHENDVSFSAMKTQTFENALQSGKTWKRNSTGFVWTGQFTENTLHNGKIWTWKRDSIIFVWTDRTHWKRKLFKTLDRHVITVPVPLH